MTLTPTQKRRVRLAIADFCERAETARLKWHYTKNRPFGGFGAEPEVYHANDCSGYCGLAFNWAMHKTGVYLPDPLNERYTGWGNTGTQLAFLKSHPVASKFLVGDMALFGSLASTEHTSICRKAGTAATAVFSSNGHESWVFNRDAPEPITLEHEKALQHLVGVYRHSALL